MQKLEHSQFKLIALYSYNTMVLYKCIIIIIIIIIIYIFK